MMIRNTRDHDSSFRHTTSNMMFKVDKLVSVLIFLIILIKNWIQVSDELLNNYTYYNKSIT